MKIFGYSLAGLTGFLVIASAINFFVYGSFWFFAPKYEAVRRDVMIQSRYYSEATVRELYRMKRQWDAASTPTAKATIRAAALHEFEIFDANRLPPDLRIWFSQLQRGG